MGKRQIWGMALFRYVLAVGFGTWGSPYWLGEGRARGFRASLIWAVFFTAFLSLMDWRDRRRTQRQRP
jgi:hypothetical protein